MANYFQIDAAFWTDPDIVDEFTPEDKYFYLYLLTSVHANISGCYEVSIKQIADEMGYSKDSVEHLISRFMNVHKLIDYDKATKEVLVHKWGKHHWTASEKYAVALKKKIDVIKSVRFKAFLQATFDRFSDPNLLRDTVWIPYLYGMDTTYTYTYIYNYYIGNSIEKEEIGGTGGREEKTEQVEAETVSPEDVPVITLPTIDNYEYPITQGFYLEMQKSYPVVDVMQELRNMRAWCISNPKRRKTRNGIHTFVNNWLAKEQDKGGRQKNYGGNGYGDGRSLGFAGVDLGGLE